MSGEVWDTPIVVPVGSVVPTTYFENVRENIVVLGSGGGKGAPSSAVASTANLSLPNDIDEVFYVTGTSSVQYIATGSRPVGNRICLIKKTGTAGLSYGGSSPPTGYLPIYGNGAGTNTQTWQPERMVILVMSDTAWHHDMVF